MTEVSIPTESIPLNPKGHCSAIDSQENNQDESMAQNSASSKLPEAEVIIPTCSHIVTSDNKFRPPISILPEESNLTKIELHYFLV
jgi:hypothetical protein